MKVNLLWGTGDELDDSININAVRGESVVNLDEAVEDAEATEIIALDVIDYVSPEDTDAVIDHWIKKLRHGGSLTIGGVNIFEVARCLNNYSLDIDMANKLLYGEQRSPWQYRKASLSLPRLVEKFEGCGLKIIRKDYKKFNYSVTGRRP